MSKMNRAVRVGCVLAMGWCATAITGARADVLDQIPSDAAIVIKLNHVADSNQKVATLLEQLGITDLVPTMKDPLQAFEDSVGFGAGIDTKRDAAMFLRADSADKLFSGDQQVVTLVPVSDYKAFIASQELVRTDKDTTVVHFKGKEIDELIQQWGDYAAISQSEDALAVKHDGLKVTGTAGKELANDDLVLFANIPALKPMLLPKLDDGEKELLKVVEKQFSDPAQQKVADAAAEQLIKGAREFLNDAQGSAIGVTINSDGIKGCFTIDFAPDSYLGKIASTMKQTDGPLLAGLPKEDYLAFGGMVQDPEWTGKLFDDMLNPISAELPGLGDNGKKFQDGLAAYREAMGTAQGIVFGVVVPTGPAGQTSLLQEIVVMNGDSAKFKAATGKGMDLATVFLNAFMQIAMPGGGGNAAAPAADLLKMTATPNYKTIGDVALDRWQIQIDPDNTSQQAMRLGASFSTMYGPDGMSMVGGTIDPKLFIIGLGTPDQVMTDAINSAKSGQDVLSDTVKDIDAQLPKNRALVEYFGLGQYLSTIFNYMKTMGVPINVAVPANLPPMGITVASEQSSLRVDVYVPIKLMQGVTQAGMQAYMQMMGRQNGGGAGGGGGL